MLHELAALTVGTRPPVLCSAWDVGSRIPTYTFQNSTVWLLIHFEWEDVSHCHIELFLPIVETWQISSQQHDLCHYNSKWCSIYVSCIIRKQNLRKKHIRMKHISKSVAQKKPFPRALVPPIKTESRGVEDRQEERGVEMRGVSHNEKSLLQFHHF